MSNPSLGPVYQAVRTLAFQLHGCDLIRVTDRPNKLLRPNAVEATWVRSAGSVKWTLTEFHIMGDLEDLAGGTGELYSKKSTPMLMNGEMVADPQWLYELLKEVNPEAL